VDLDADGYTEILNHRKILRKTQKNNNLLITKRILKPKYKPRGARCLHLACQGGRFAPLPTRQLLHCSCTSREGELPKCFQHNFSYRFLRCLFDITKYFDVCDIFLKLVIIPYCLYCLSSLESITVYRSNKKIIPKVSNWNGDACQRFSYNQLIPRADPATAVGGGDISVILYLVDKPYYGFTAVREMKYFTTLLWQNSGRQNGLIPRMLFSDIYKIMVDKATFVGLREGDRPNRTTPGSAPELYRDQIIAECR